jgi:hypothetical protein
MFARESLPLSSVPHYLQIKSSAYDRLSDASLKQIPLRNLEVAS